jgi:hypothetical protein
MWDSQANTPWKVPSNPIIIGDRSPAASFLQDAYPGGNNPYGNEYWKLLYGKMDWVPFPDILPLLFPDDINKQIQRLEERGRNGDTVDQFDNPDKQIKQFEGFKALADILFKFPGVYKIISGEIRRGYEDLKSVDPGFILSLLTTAYAIEKGVTPGIKETSLGQFIRYGGIKRIEGNQSITAYAIDLTLTPYFIEASGGETTRRVLKEYLTARFGDIGICWPYADNLGTSPFKAVVYALEPGAKGLKTEEVHDYINTRIKLSLVEVNKETRYGKDLFKSRFSGIQRAWRNITW